VTRTTETRPTALRRWVNLRTVSAAIGVIVLVAAVLSVKVVGIEDAQSDAPEAFDPAAFAQAQYAGTIVPYIKDNAIDLATLVTELAAGADPAEFGKSSGNGSAYAFPVTFTATAEAATPPVLPLTVSGIPADVQVVMQIGPAMSGTAIRDVTGTITFDQFTNQLEYQNVGTELNNMVKSTVLAQLDAAALEGKTVLVTGAILWGNPKFISVVPISVEVQP
jgi:predicted lipoprotein